MIFHLPFTIYHFSFAIAGQEWSVKRRAVGKKAMVSMKNGK
jgi:hypothetical protein